MELEKMIYMLSCIKKSGRRGAETPHLTPEEIDEFFLSLALCVQECKEDIEKLKAKG